MSARRWIAAVTTASALAGPASALADAGAPVAVPAKSSIAEICVFRAAVHDTPRGLVVGYLHDGARVRLLSRTSNRRWYRIRGPLQLEGWLKARSVCR